MIYDCFTFYNELELLDIRLHELDKIVDKFILTESTVTFTNKPKKLFYQDNKHLFKKFHKKIIHNVVKDNPNVYGNAWIIEHHQLAAATRGLPKCNPDDTILISCVDEIPKAEKVLEWKDKSGRHKVFSQRMSYYFFNYVRQDEPFADGTMMFRYKDLSYYQDIYVARFTPVDVRISDGGWHFSFMGGVKRIRTKLMSYSHQEFNNPNYNTPERIKAAIVAGKDLFRQGHTFDSLPYEFLPQYVQDNKDKFAENLIEPHKKPSYFHYMYTAALEGIGKGRDIARTSLKRFGLKDK